MKANVASGSEQVVDARGPGKFDGSQPDVFPFKKVGHLPNAVNVPWADLLHPEKGTFSIQRRSKRASRLPESISASRS